MPRPFAVVAAAVAVAGTAAHAQEPPRSHPDTTWYTVQGQRHGVSFFRRHRHAQVEYDAGDALTFDRYHTVDVMDAWLRRWAERHPDLVDLYEVGTSFEGRPILQVTLTSKKTGPALEKPAAFFEGGRHSGEITGSESVLWLIRHLLARYGRDARITELLDTKAIHLRPQNNPDGSNLYLHTAQRNRSTVRPHDSDRDGLVDEDPEEDLEGDGVIYELRRRVRAGEEAKGNATPREAPTVRIVTPATRDKVIAAGWTRPGERKAVTFEVRTYGVAGVRGTVHVMSTRGGLVKVPLTLGRP
ncbi:MAG: M14 family zinc carboxypeptidase [Gemmatimonadales bacterium]